MERARLLDEEVDAGEETIALNMTDQISGEDSAIDESANGDSIEDSIRLFDEDQDAGEETLVLKKDMNALADQIAAEDAEDLKELEGLDDDSLLTLDDEVEDGAPSGEDDTAVAEMDEIDLLEENDFKLDFSALNAILVIFVFA